MAHSNTSKVLELFGNSTRRDADWTTVIRDCRCPFSSTRCFKVRKSDPDIAIGTCTVQHGRDNRSVIICPNRLLERRSVFMDCLHLLTRHEPGNQLHVVPEIAVPGGNVDYFLVSARRGKVRDFVAIEFQTLDTTGTVWPARQRLLRELKLPVSRADTSSHRTFGMNWKMTAKTTLVQLHHKVATLEHVGKHYVLAIQDCLLGYFRNNFKFDHIKGARIGDTMHFHAYRLGEVEGEFRIELEERVSTDAAGVAACLGIQANPRVELEVIVAELEKKLSSQTVLAIDAPIALAEAMPTE